MRTDTVDLQQMRAVALALPPRCRNAVFVGGTVTSVLVTDPASRETRASLDVDVVVETNSRSDYAALEEELRANGFAHAIEPEAPVCRWRLGELTVDVMPDDSAILGFSNRWYGDVIATAASIDVDGVTIRVAAAPAFVATKIEAFMGRGGGDFLASKDLEDIITVLDGRPAMLDEIATAREPLREFVMGWLVNMRTDDRFFFAVQGNLRDEPGRVELVFERLATITSPAAAGHSRAADR